jgi:hypothetical protein
VGPVGGYGWILQVNQGSPRNIRFEDIEVLPETTMLLSIPYPAGTTFQISANAASWCNANTQYSCTQPYQQVASIEQVRDGPGNQYHVDANNVVTFRIVQTPKDYVGRPGWFLPTRDDLGYGGRGHAVERVERAGVYLPRATYGPNLQLVATCSGSGPYCAGTAPAPYDPNPCPSGFTVKAYDRCCSNANPSSCRYADGSSELVSTSENIPETSSSSRRAVQGVVLLVGWCWWLRWMVMA